MAKEYRIWLNIWKGATAFFWAAVAIYATLQATAPQLLSKWGEKYLWAAIALAVLAAADNWRKHWLVPKLETKVCSSALVAALLPLLSLGVKK